MANTLDQVVRAGKFCDSVVLRHKGLAGQAARAQETLSGASSAPEKSNSRGEENDEIKGGDGGNGHNSSIMSGEGPGG